MLLLSVTLSYAQKKGGNYYTSPLKRTLDMSANFGELRSNHFHSGIDFRIGQVEGAPVYAVANAYISRIVVRPDGYGKALYLTHPNGTTSVYAHLASFIPKISTWVKAQQYEQKSFTVDLALGARQFPLQQGELIGYAGNSGRSFGPHLHFEIRDAHQQPINIMREGIYNIPDNTPPTAAKLYVYGFDTIEQSPIVQLRQSIAIKGTGKKLFLANGDTILLNEPVFFGVAMMDQITGSSKIFGVSECELFLNEKSIFKYTLNKFNFAETRYVNAMLDFTSPKPAFTKLVQLYCAPHNPLPFIQCDKEQAIINLGTKQTLALRLVLRDDAKNVSELKFWVTQKTAPIANKAHKYASVLKWNKENHFERNGFTLSMPVGALYRDELLSIVFSKALKNQLSPVFRIKSPATSPHKAVSVGIEANIPKKLHRNVAMVCTEGNGKRKYLTSSYVNPYFIARTRVWGAFQLLLDTIAPEIIPINFKHKGSFNKPSNQLQIKIIDKQTEVDSYTGTIDGKWTLFEYDQKNDLLIYNIDNTRIQTNKNHRINIVTTDIVGNTARASFDVFF
ncbi:MAG: M23 family metallopeptidase [Bacteroidales bacterium]